METLFLVCAITGGTLMACQFLASLFGIGGEHGDGAGHDVGHDLHDMGGHDAGHEQGAEHDGTSSWFFGMLSFRALAAAVAFFGLAGLAAHYGGLEAGHSLLVALGSGFAALYAVASMMKLLARLKSDGTVKIDRAIGETCTVYLRIPGNRAGAGKVTLVLQNRTIECQAVTAADALPTGARVKVVAIVSPDTVEVAPVSVETPSHV